MFFFLHFNNLSYQLTKKSFSSISPMICISICLNILDAACTFTLTHTCIMSVYNISVIAYLCIHLMVVAYHTGSLEVQYFTLQAVLHTILL